MWLFQSNFNVAIALGVLLAGLTHVFLTEPLTPIGVLALRLHEPQDKKRGAESGSTSLLIEKLLDKLSGRIDSTN